MTAAPSAPPVAPMLAKLTRELPATPGLFYEPKWDGFRCIVFRDGDDVELGSRNEKPLTRYFPELVEALRRELPDRCVLDGEIVIAGPRGPRLRRPLPADPPRRVADPPAGGGDARVVRGLRPAWPTTTRSCMETPYAQRRSALEKLLRKARPPVHVTPVTDDPDVAAGLVLPVRGRRARRRGGQAGGPALPAGQAGDAQGQAPTHGRLRRGRLPDAQGRRRRGIAAARPVRRRRGPCTTSVSPRASAWRGGASWWTSSSPTAPSARTGHPWAVWADAAGRAPGGTNRWNAGKDMTWEPLRAELVCEVSYDHLQEDRFRHATSFVRWRPDRDPASCTYDQLDTPVPYELAKVFGTG